MRAEWSSVNMEVGNRRGQTCVYAGAHTIAPNPKDRNRREKPVQETGAR